jgi:hypothetical protein
MTTRSPPPTDCATHVATHRQTPRSQSTSPISRQPARVADEVPSSFLGESSMNHAILYAADLPNKDWTLKKLENYALERATEICGFGRKTLTQIFLFGSALSLIQKIKKEEKTWMKWVKTQPYSLSTAAHAIELSRRVIFEELDAFNGMTTNETMIILDILKKSPPKKLRKQTPAATSPDVANAPDAQDGSPDQSNDDAPEQAATERKVTVTDYSQKRSRKNAEPVVGASLTASEVLGQVLNLIVQAEKIGITPDCNDILAEITTKITTLTQTLKVVTAA